jgi:hypothetical protein
MSGVKSMKLRALMIGALFGASALLAQDPPSQVARLNWINGSVSFQPASLDTWTSATVNYPLTTGDHLYTDRGARAEIHVGPNAIRLDSQTNFGFLNLDDQTVQMRFTEGAIEVRLRALNDQDAYEVDTPNGAISLLRTGDYRIDTDPDRNATMVTVYSGEAEVTAEGNSFSVRPRQTAYFSGGGAPDIRSENSPDDFDRFTADRNAREERVPPPQHVSSSMIGYEDLDAYGAWREVPEYGWCWAPPVAAGWAPYHDGHWAWVEPWGWTWIDDAPWGFAPFHYGRWAFSTGSWFWVPGPVAVRPIYAPHLVAFVGGPRFGIGVGWFPLGPREVYRPAYHVSDRYIRNVNTTNVTNINVTNINVTNVHYVNQNVPGAVIAVPQNSFATARPVREGGRRVTPQEMAQAQVVGTAPQVTPQRESMMGNSRAGGNVARPRQDLVARQVVVKQTPPPAPVSFQAQQSELARNQGRPLAPDQVSQLRQRQPDAVIRSAPFRAARAPQAVGRPVPAPSPAPGNAPQIEPNSNPSRRGSPNVDRLDSRPPEVSRPEPVRPERRIQPPAPEINRPAPEPQPAPANRPEFNRRQIPEQRPNVDRPAPENRRPPDVRRPEIDRRPPPPPPQAAPAPAPPPQAAPAQPPPAPRAAPPQRNERNERNERGGVPQRGAPRNDDDKRDGRR